MLLQLLENCSKCTNEFIIDIKKLCIDCPIRQQVIIVRENMINKFGVLKEIEPVETVLDYLKEKIVEGRAKIEHQINFESCNKDAPQIRYRPNRIAIVLSFKDCAKYYGEQLEIINKKQNNSIKNTPKTLSDIFSSEESKIKVILDALKELSITKHCSDRNITGFVDGCKSANALPNIASIHLMKVIYKEIGKPIGENIKHHTDQPAYDKSWKATKKYFGIK